MSASSKPESEHGDRVEAVLDALLDAEPARRPALLDGLCAGDAELRGEVEDLLRREQASRGLLGTPAPELARKLLERSSDKSGPPAPVAGRRIGPYRVLLEIGRGGMGRVYLADRADGAFEQQIALKILRPGLDEPDAERRFRSERNILAALEHPNIARLLDGGVTDDGVPWLAMEYVEGSPIDEHCDAHRLPVRRRIDLFLTLISAVRYAHRSLVVHRDLKPSNIQITRDSGLKLLDFGIAKLLSGPGEETDPLTRPGHRFLTLEYAAPEQVRGETITTATDVYQLGVVLYELLTGRRPFERRGTSSHELREAILEREPERPSTAVSARASSRWSRSGPGAVVDEEARGESPGGVDAPRVLPSDRLHKALAGDLDAIILRALRKEPEARYASAGEMGDDLQRYLVGLPVLAREPSRVYRLRKFARRHRWGLVVAAGFLLFVAGFGTIHTLRLTAERDRVGLEAAKSREVTAFLMGLFEANDPRLSAGDAVTARELLERGVTEIEALDAQPEVQAQMFDVLGSVYRSLGRYDEARPLSERAVAMWRGLSDAPNADLAASLHDLARVLRDQGEYDAAEPLYREALSMRRELLGETDVDIARSLDGLGGLLHQRGEHEEAESLLREALDMKRRLFGDRHPDIAGTLNDLGLLLTDMGDFARAESVHREALAMRRELPGEHRLDVAYSLGNLALVLHRRGDLDEAEPLYREVMALDRELLGEHHPDYALDLNNLGGLLADRGDLEGAESLHREALAIYRRSLGPVHPRIAQSLNNLGVMLVNARDYDAAEPLFREALAMRRDLLGDSHPAVATVMANLAATLMEAGDLRDAEALHRDALAIRREAFGPDHPDVGHSLYHIARTLLRAGDHEEAESSFREAVGVAEASRGESHWMSAYYRAGLGGSLTALGRYAEAEALLVAAHARLAEERGADHANTRAVLERLVTLYEEWGKPDEATRVRTALERPDP